MKAILVACLASVPMAGMAYDPTLPEDSRGKGTVFSTLMRTPTGLLYDWPLAPPLVIPMQGGWSYALSAELGAIGVDGDREAARFREYRDWREGALVSHLHAGLGHAGSARHLDFTARNVGRDDQSYAAAFVRHGDFGVRAFLADIPHLFATGVRTAYDGAGGGRLTLLPGLVPGDNAPGAVLAAVQAASPLEIALRRRRAGMEAEATPSEAWRFFARYAQERREGARPFGGTLGFNFPASAGSGGLSELIEPVRYRSHDFTAGAQLSRDAYQVNVSYTGSFFRNDIDALTWDNPFRVSANPTAPLVARGRTDLAPDNDHHNLRVDFARAALPMHGQLTGSFSYHRMSQDDALVAPSINSGVLEAFGGSPALDLAQWNTTAALSRTNADARIDTWVSQLGYSFSPAGGLAVRVKLRQHKEDNKTEYTAFNPLTGQFGYLPADGALFVGGELALTGLPFPGGSAFSALPIRYRSIPFAHRRDNASLEADYRMGRRTTLEASYGREEIRREHRERDRTWEDRLRVGLSSREIAWATLRASYEFAKRSGGAYDPNPYEAFFLPSPAPGAPPFTLAELRKFDLSDRRQHALNARLNVLVRDDTDLMLSARLVDNDHGADYGRKGDRTYGFSVDASFQPGPRAGAFAHYDFRDLRVRQATINDNPVAALTGSADAAAGGAVYPLENLWEASSRDRTHVFTAGLRFTLPRTRLESSYSFVHGRHRIGYAFASPAALATPGVAAQAGDAMPDIRMRRHVLEASAVLSLAASTALRLYYRYERGRLEDWHYTGLPLVVGNELFLGAGPESYDAHVVGLFLQYSLERPRPK